MRLTNIVWTSAIIAAAILLTAALSTASLRAQAEPEAEARKNSGAGPGTKAGKAAQIARGEYLVEIMGCHDCHTPAKMGPNGPEQDRSRALSGHPEELVMPPAPALPPGPWVASIAATFTAFASPGGTVFTRNLTPDKETGLGTWTEEMFIATMRTARHQGKGRPILPPMPVKMIGRANDEDLKSIFAYLQSLAPVKNRVPTPIEPAEEKK